MDPRIIYEDDTKEITHSFFQKVYAWMGGGLLLTAITSVILFSIPTLFYSIMHNTFLLFLLFGGELFLVFKLSASIGKISTSSAKTMFILYSILNGITLSSIFAIYTRTSIALTFFITAGMFFAMSAYGYFTKKDLTRMGNFMIMGVIGIIIASLLNIFFRSPGIYWTISFFGVIIFTGLTAYDTQRIKSMSSLMLSDENMAEKGAIIGALMLYLDFINLFLMLLRFFGRRD